MPTRRAVGSDGPGECAVSSQDRQGRLEGGELGPGGHGSEQGHGRTRGRQVGAIATGTATERNRPGRDSQILEDVSLAPQASFQSAVAVFGGQQEG